MAFGTPEPYGDTYSISLQSKLHGMERIDMGVMTFQTSASYAPDLEADLEIFHTVLREAGFQVSVTKRTMTDAAMEAAPVEE